MFFLLPQETLKSFLRVATLSVLAADVFEHPVSPEKSNLDTRLRLDDSFNPIYHIITGDSREILSV